MPMNTFISYPSTTSYAVRIPEGLCLNLLNNLFTGTFRWMLAPRGTLWSSPLTTAPCLPIMSNGTYITPPIDCYRDCIYYSTHWLLSWLHAYAVNQVISETLASAESREHTVLGNLSQASLINWQEKTLQAFLRFVVLLVSYNFIHIIRIASLALGESILLSQGQWCTLKNIVI